MGQISRIFSELGYRKPVNLPSRVLEGPIRFQGTYDYDANAADTTVIDFTAAAAQVDDSWVNMFSAAATPKVMLHIEGFEISFNDVAVADHVDPEDVLNVFRDLFFEYAIGDKTYKAELFKACGVPVGHGAALDSDITTTTIYYNFATPSFAPLPHAIRCDLEDALVCMIRSGTAGNNSLLTADSVVDCWVHGYAYHKAAASEDDRESWGSDNCGVGTVQEFASEGRQRVAQSISGVGVRNTLKSL